MSVEINTGRTFVSILNKEAWYDPRLLSVVTGVRTNDVTVNSSHPVMIAPADTTRLMIGFISPNPADTMLIAPWPDVNAFSLFNLAGNNLFYWAKIFDYGTLINNAWYGFSSSGGPFRIVTIYRVDGR